MLCLPQINVRYPFAIPAAQHLLVLGGRRPSASWFASALRGRILWAVDGGVDVCHAVGATPKRLIGDADSANPTAWQWAKDAGADVLRFPTAKDFTDTQLALSMLKEMPAKVAAVISGSFGGRCDHLFSTIHSAANAKFPCCLADDREIVLFAHGMSGTMEIFFLQTPKAVSLLPMTAACEGVSTYGLRWSLYKATLHQNFPFAISNTLANDNYCSIEIERGILGVYMCFGDEM